MKRQESAEEHLEKQIKRSAERYVNGLQKTGLKRSEKLERAIAERTLREARESHIREATETRDHNIAAIMRKHHEEMNAIKRSGAKLRWKMCPLIALVFGAAAWYNFGRLGDGFLFGILYTVFALAFVAMLVFGAIFDRPTKP